MNALRVSRRRLAGLFRELAARRALPSAAIVRDGGAGSGKGGMRQTGPPPTGCSGGIRTTTRANIDAIINAEIRIDCRNTPRSL